MSLLRNIDLTLLRLRPGLSRMLRGISKRDASGFFARGVYRSSSENRFYRVRVRLMSCWSLYV